MAAGLGMTLLVAGVRMRHFLPAAAVTIPAGALFCFTRMAHVQSRINTWLHPGADPFGSGHQVNQSLIALGSGETPSRFLRSSIRIQPPALHR